MIAAVIMYSFFYPTAYKAQSAEDIPIVIVDQEQKYFNFKIISQAAIVHIFQSQQLPIIS